MTELQARRALSVVLRRVPLRVRPILRGAHNWYWNRNWLNATWFYIRNPRVYLMVRKWKSGGAIIQA